METSLFDEKTEDELWKEFKKTKSPAIRDKFIRQYMPLVKYVAGKVSTGMPDSVEFDDLVGYGQFGLLDAINKFDPDKNVKFKTKELVSALEVVQDVLERVQLPLLAPLVFFVFGHDPNRVLVPVDTLFEAFLGLIHALRLV